MYSASFREDFLDTNVLVSAFAARGLCAEVLELVLLDHDLIIGRNVLRELEKALREKVKLSVARSTEIINFVSGEATQVVDMAEAAQLDIDAADALVVGEALAGQAELFVTGDAALLRLAAAESLKVLSPRQFWETLRT
jgi:putative PIN family toxin of toxin-antitoxin system